MYLSYEDKMNLIASKLKEQINRLDALPEEDAKREAHEGLVRVGIIDNSGNLTPPYAALADGRMCCGSNFLGWSTIQKEYPDMWVALEDVVTEDSSIIFASVVDSCLDAELAEMKKKYRPVNQDHHFWFVRTAEGNGTFLLNLSCNE